METPDVPPVPVEGLPPGWSMEQWNHYGALWIKQEAMKATEQEKDVPAATHISPYPTLQPNLTYPSNVPYGQPVEPLTQVNTPPLQPAPPTLQPVAPAPEPVSATFALGARPSVKIGEARPDYQFHQGPIIAPGSMVPAPNYSIEARYKKGWKSVIYIASVFLTVSIVAALLMSSTVQVAVTELFDDDFDDDGISNSDEDKNDTDPRNPDSDGDSIPDGADMFPNDSSEWADLDGDGIGDNADNDDDGDGIIAEFDVNDRVDTAMILEIEKFKAIEKMDYFDNYAEVYICIQVYHGIDQQDLETNESIIPISYGCAPDANSYWSLETGYSYIIEHEFFIDLPDDKGAHMVEISAYDSDVSVDDSMDINNLSADWDPYYFYHDSNPDSVNNYQSSTTISGVGDGAGWDGEVTFKVDRFNLVSQRISEFIWDFNGDTFTLNLPLSRSDYTKFKNLDHSVDGDEDYARFSTPNEQYVHDIATKIVNLAELSGYTSDLQKAEFIYSFVGSIDYVYDLEGSGEREYPKYPIEMLWEAGGDCEDSSALYISLVESIGYDAVLALVLVKENKDEEWGGHAMVGINVEGASGSYFEFGWTSDKSDVEFYMVETTGYYEGQSEIGRNPWYDMDDIELFDIGR